jgi:hypothetical protein
MAKKDLAAMVRSLDSVEKEQLGQALVDAGLDKEFNRADMRQYFKKMKNNSKGRMKTIFAILQHTPERLLDNGVSTYLKIRLQGKTQ